MKKGRGKTVALAIGILIVLLLPVLRIAFLQYVADHRVKGQFEFTAEDAQAGLTDAQAVEYAKEALRKAGYDPTGMGVVTDQGINAGGLGFTVFRWRGIAERLAYCFRSNARRSFSAIAA
jgi:hypothetical protein